MAYQTVFKRYEFKYLLTSEQKETVLQAMEPYMKLDRYGRTTIRNIYFDTENYRLIRRSIDGPAYKEKLRLRSYSQATPNSTVFAELKKKYDHVVYKRRMSITEKNAMHWLCDRGDCPEDSQISHEIDYFLKFYGVLRPVVYLSYEREAFYDISGGDFRVTFDDHILCRQENISLTSPTYGTPLLADGTVLMEIKCSCSVPLWMTNVLSRIHQYKTSFSKYGTAYKTVIYPQIYRTRLQNSKEILIHA